ncbi:aldo/keto reductase [Streptomyces sp. NPDC058280]|uniref:aldo/keto reductase n=1 Tax=Streptomyces sp. NPDC058280 TaxID=3346419 RepID=UPI0036E6AC57
MQRRRIGGPSGVSAGVLCLGTLPFGSTVDEETSFAILDRFVEAGGNLIDTANNYVFWHPGTTGDESETTIGRWLASRRVRDEVLISTKAGARPTVPGTGLETAEGLSAAAIRKAAQESLRRLGTDRIDLYWTHIEDRSVPLEETLGTLNELVSDGQVSILGCSNHTTWRTERARAVALANGWTGYTCVQQRHSYLQPRFDMSLPESGHVHVTPELLDYARSEPDLTVMAYSSLLSGAYTRADKPLAAAYDHPGTGQRLAVLREVAAELGATPNQVVLAWLLGGDPPVIPVVGASSVEQLDDVLGALAVELAPDLRARLDQAALPVSATPVP